LNEFRELLNRILDPPRTGAPDASSFGADLNRFGALLERLAPDLPEEELRQLAALEDVSREVVYYLIDDPLYDAGHDIVWADYSLVRRFAEQELRRRARLAERI
jgi:hypothetical protein